MAKVKMAFTGVPDGEVYGKEFQPGDDVEGELAAVAIREGWAEDGAGVAEEKAQQTAPENKAKKAAPENK